MKTNQFRCCFCNEIKSEKRKTYWVHFPCLSNKKAHYVGLCCRSCGEFLKKIPNNHHAINPYLNTDGRP